MTWYLFLQIVSNKWEQKCRVPDTYYINNGYTNLLIVYEEYIDFDTEQAGNTQKGKKIVSQKNR